MDIAPQPTLESSQETSPPPAKRACTVRPNIPPTKNDPYNRLMRHLFYKLRMCEVEEILNDHRLPYTKNINLKEITVDNSLLIQVGPIATGSAYARCTPILDGKFQWDAAYFCSQPMLSKMIMQHFSVGTGD